MNSRFARYLRFLVACCALFIALPTQASSTIGARDPIVLVAETLRDEEADDETGTPSSISASTPSTTREQPPAAIYQAPDRALVARKYIHYCALLC